MPGRWSYRAAGLAEGAEPVEPVERVEIVERIEIVENVGHAAPMWRPGHE